MVPVSWKSEFPGPRDRRPAVGVLLAGGSGVRSGLDYPKQFLRLGGRTVLEHSLATFEAADCIDEIIIVIAEPWIASAQALVAASGARKVTAVMPGGATRNLSTQAAITQLTASRRLADAKVLIHDAVRPLVSPDILQRCVAALDSYDAVDVVVEADDTIVEVHDDLVTGIPPRRHLRRGQTPQAFALRLLQDAYAAFSEEELARFTDDCAVVMQAFPGTPVLALSGSPDNMKITHPIDICIADRLLQMRQAEVPAPRDPPAALGAVVVIGGSSGIGAATVQTLRAAGVRAVSLSRTHGGVDVRDPDALAAALRAARAEHGPIGAVVNCAGLLTRGDLLELSPEEIHDQLEINLGGSIHVARAAHQWLRETAGHLVLFTSSSYTRGRGGYAVYSATKAAVVNLAQALAEEWAADAIKVSCINPARTNTPMRTQAFGAEPAGSLLDAGTVADTVAAVLRTDATGHVYDVRAANPVTPSVPRRAAAA